MTNNFKIGSVWKTRGGWRAVVVNKREADGWIKVYHSTETEETYWTHSDGMFNRGGDHDYDLIEPWVEPKVHDVWCNIYWTDKCFKLFDGCFYSTKEAADDKAGWRRIACINVKFPEGEGL